MACSPCALPAPLPPLVQAALETARKKRLNELLQNHCKKALGHITSHKVRFGALWREALALHAAVVLLWQSVAGLLTQAACMCVVQCPCLLYPAIHMPTAAPLVLSHRHAHFNPTPPAPAPLPSPPLPAPPRLQWSWPFNAPVDLKQYPDYAETIKNPMDFGTIKRWVGGCESGLDVQRWLLVRLQSLRTPPIHDDTMPPQTAQLATTPRCSLQAHRPRRVPPPRRLFGGRAPRV